MRQPNENQTIEEFKFLGHKPMPRVYFPGSKYEANTFTCTICHGDLGSSYGVNPCGDPNGNTLQRVVTPVLKSVFTYCNILVYSPASAYDGILSHYTYKGRDL
jgi:hypothetical protein